MSRMPAHSYPQGLAGYLTYWSDNCNASDGVKKNGELAISTKAHEDKHAK